MLESHFFNMVFYAVIIATLFSIFMKEGLRERLRFVVTVSASMVGAAVVVAWLMLLAR